MRVAAARVISHCSPCKRRRSRPEALWPSLMPQLLLSAVPDSTGDYETPALTWTLFQVDVAAPGATVRVDLGLAQKDGKTYIVLLQTGSDEYDALHEGVFLPVLDALAPLAPSTEDLPYAVEDVSFENGDVTLAVRSTCRIRRASTRQSCS